MNKWIFLVTILLLTGFTIASTSSAPSYCCEKTTSGAWCVNAPQSSCDSNYNSAPTSCDTTSYCRLGTCYDSTEGICMGNTPQKVCNNNNGTWSPKPENELSQCSLGCCVIADQAAFVSLVRCKKLSSLFGVKNNYDTSITSEVDCIAKAQSQDVGACVYKQGNERICKFSTRKDCGATNRIQVANQSNISLTDTKTFYKNYLCSAEELSTSCAKEVGTVCYKGDVYWTDSCGNRENIYSSDKVKSWNNGRVATPSSICKANDGSNVNCGNCDYLLGTRCAAFKGIIGGPSGSNNYCKKTECIDNNHKKRMNGESWCVKSAGIEKDEVGSRYYRDICVDGSVEVEPCADYRNEVCIESSIDTSAGKFETAACRVNRWQDCIMQTKKSDCLNIDQRDCKWLPSVLGMIIGGQTQSNSVTYSNPTKTASTFTNPTATPFTGNSIFGGGSSSQETTTPATTGASRPNGVCVPNFPPGLKFWEKGSAKNICGQANAKCVVVYKKSLLGGNKIVKGEECLQKAWAENANNICTSLGDCGGSTNYNGVSTSDGYSWIIDGQERKL